MTTYLSRAFALLLAILSVQFSTAQIGLEIKDLHLGCIKNLTDIPAPDIRSVRIIGGCRNPKISHVDDFTTEEPCKDHKRITRKYRVTDDCGNESIATQKIFFTYNTTGGQDIFITVSLGCNPELPGAIPDPGKFNPPGCSEKFKWLSDERGHDGCNYWLTRKYLIYTRCGSYVYTVQYTWKVDHTPPEIQCPDTLDLGCNPASLPAPDPTTVHAKDECCDPVITWIGDIIIDNFEDCRQYRIRKYMAEDCCGNQSFCEQVITWISDITPPVIVSCPAGKDLGCNPKYDNIEDLLPKPTPHEIKARDLCSKIKVRYELSDITVFGCQYSITRTYIVSDACGNEASCFQTFTWTVDHEPPVIEHCPGPKHLGCNPDPTDFDLQSPDFGIIATDRCGIAKIVREGITETVSTGCEKYYFINYAVYDHCGNKALCQQQIIWTEDKEPPVITCPPDEFYCGDHEIPDVDLEKVIASDNCGLADVYMSASSISLINGIITLTRTFTAVDECGNQTSCDQTITILGGNVPDYSQWCPEDVNFGCVMEYPEIPEPLSGFITAGGCDQVLLSHLGDDLLLVSPCEYLLTRSYEIIDCCNNQDVCFQQFRWRLVDDTTTHIDVPEDQIAFCAIPPLPDFAHQCGKYIPVYLGQTIEGDCSDGSCTIIRHWKTSTCDGAELVHDQIITVKCDITAGHNRNAGEAGEVGTLPWSIYPNPASDYLFIDLRDRGLIESVEILDLNGRLIRQKLLNQKIEDNYRLSVDDLTDGIYIIRINGDAPHTERFIKSQ